MSPENKNELMRIENSLATFADNPAAQIDIAEKINLEVYEIFEIDKLLNELNGKLFEGKGEIAPINQDVFIKPEIDQNQNSEQQSRFKRLFTLSYQTKGTTLGAELYIKKKSLPNTIEIDHLSGIGIKVYQIVNTQEEILSINFLGKLYFSPSSGERSSNGRWDNSPTFLYAQSQGKALSFSLRSIPPANEVKMAFWENIAQILNDLSINNLVPQIDSGKDDTAKSSTNEVI